MGDTDGRLLHSLIADEDSILALAWTPDGKTLITSSSDGSIRFRDAATLDPIRVIDHQPDWVEALSISPDGTRLAAGRFNGTLSLFDMKSFKEVWDRGWRLNRTGRRRRAGADRQPIVSGASEDEIPQGYEVEQVVREWASAKATAGYSHPKRLESWTVGESHKYEVVP